jgi:hypothetical protein
MILIVKCREAIKIHVLNASAALASPRAFLHLPPQLARVHLSFHKHQVC